MLEFELFKLCTDLVLLPTLPCLSGSGGSPHPPGSFVAGGWARGRLLWVGTSPHASACLPAWPLGTSWPSVVPNSRGEDPARMTDENVLHLPAPVESDGRTELGSSRSCTPGCTPCTFKRRLGFVFYLGGSCWGTALFTEVFSFSFFKKQMFTLPSLNYFLKKQKMWMIKMMLPLDLWESRAVRGHVPFVFFLPPLLPIQEPGSQENEGPQ